VTEPLLYYELGMMPDVTIYPVADVHCGSEGSDLEGFDLFLKQVRSEPRSYLFLMGDLIDNGIKNSVTNVFRATMQPGQQKRHMAGLLEQVADRILALVPGNHCRRNRDVDNDPVYDIAAKLDLEDRYRESMAFVRIGLGKNSHGKEQSYRIVLTHGSGGGGKAGTMLSKMDDYSQSIDGADVFIYAHSHRPGAQRSSKLWVDMQNRQVIQRPTLTMCAGAWLEYVGYPMDKNMRPVAMPGANKLLLYGDKWRFEAII
jgi:predicted phosphodiesterase